MKNKIAAIVLAVVLFSPGAIFAQTEIKVTLPRWNSLFGLGPKTTISVLNVTPFTTRLVALNENIARLDPGDSVFEHYSFEFDRTELPLLALIYSDTHCNNLIGIAGTVLPVRQGFPSEWKVRIGDIRYLDSNSRFFVDPAYYHYPDAVAGMKKADFPRIGYKSETIGQFANATTYEALIKLNGQNFCRLKPGEYCCFEKWLKHNRSVPVNLSVIFSKDDKMQGFYGETFYLSGNGPSAFQYVLTPRMIRRR